MKGGSLSVRVRKLYTVLNSNIATGILLAVFLVVSFVQNDVYRQADYKIVLLGAEYTTIAHSILEGKGYSNPFEYPTGPTAWMPPLLVMIHVLVIWLFGISYQAYLMLSIIKFAGLIGSYLFLAKLIDLLKLPVSKLLLVAVFFFYLSLSKFQLFQMCMEHWLFLLWGSMLLYGFLKFIRQGKGIGILALLFLLVPVSTAALFIPQSLVLLLIFIQFVFNKSIRVIRISNRVKFVHFLLFGFLSVISVSAWTYRNYKTFDTFIPSKPNTWFEFYLANIVDYQGVLHSTTYEGHHPLFNEEVAEEMARMGEINWLEPYKDSAAIYKQTHRAEYIEKVKFRAYMIFIFQKRTYDRYVAGELNPINKSDRMKLLEANLLYGNADDDDFFWNCLYMDTGLVNQKLAKLDLIHHDQVYADFLYAKPMLNVIPPRQIKYGIVKSSLPLFALFVMFILYWKKERELVIVSTMMYLIYFVPFIMVSFIERYQLFVLEYQAFFVSMLLAHLTIFIWKKLPERFTGTIEHWYKS